MAVQGTTTASGDSTTIAPATTTTGGDSTSTPPTTTAPVSTPPTVPSTPAPDAGTGKPGDVAPPVPDSGITTLPDSWQKEIKDLRTENAKHRTATKKAEAEASLVAEKQLLEDGKAKEAYEKVRLEFDELTQSLKASEDARIKMQIATKFGLPAELIDRLKGDTSEELEADAEMLKALIPGTLAPPPSGTDGTAGVNSTIPATPMPEQELKQLAVTLGVSPDHLKVSLGMNN